MAIKLETDLDRFSYGLAMNITASIKEIPTEVNTKIIAEAIGELLNGAQPQLSPEEYQKAMQEFQAKVQQAAQSQMDQAAKENIAAEKAFLDENAKKDGVIITPSGLQYQVVKEGSGPSPAANDVVSVHYEGFLLNGQVFDSSVKRCEPAKFPVNQVIAGWTEALQLMKKGSKYRLFIPAALAYGERGAGGIIGPNATLIFDVELLDIMNQK